MLHFKAKMHQIQFQLVVLCLRPRWLTAPDPLAEFGDPTTNGRKGEGKGREGRGEEWTIPPE